MDDRPGYYAVIPADVRYDDEIPANAKLLYGEISALISKDGFCFATNGYFAEIYRLSERTISGLISALQDRGYISVFLDRDASGQIQKRKIYLRVSAGDAQPVEENFYTSGKSFREGIENNFQYTNTSNTDIDKENKKESPQPEDSVPCGKKRPPKEAFNPMPLFENWIRGTFPGEHPDNLNALYSALARFVDNRLQIKKPMKSKAAVTALCNKLLDYSGGSIPAMIDLLDTATVHNWQSVYRPKGQAASSPPKEGEDEEWL